MVLTGLPDPAAYSHLLRITGLTPERFEGIYWVDRLAYDAGALTGIEFWQKINADSGLSLSQASLEELNDWDARMWTTENPAMLVWQFALKEKGILTAILSNMGEHVLANMKRTYDWLPRFDALVWSFQLKMAKPDPAIYRHALKELGTRPEETLFLDDRLENVEGANALGMRGLLFTNVEKLRADLIAQGLDGELPLPG
jgi:putative hydrolase of the HAD superfamily